MIRLNSYTKEKIIKVANKNPVKINIESDWSRMIEIKIWWNTYKILDVNLDSNSDEDVCEYDYNWGIRKWVYLSWIMGEDLDERENMKLAKYIKQQRERWFDIPTRKFQEEILNKLCNYLDCDFDVEQQIALRIYVTSLHWCYLLKNGCYGWLGLRGYTFNNSYPDANVNMRRCVSIYLISWE